MFKATLNTTISGELGRSYSVPVTIEAGGRVGLEVNVTAESTGVVACDLDVSEAVMVAMVSSRDVVVKTNSASTPDNTFTLLANVPFIWASVNGSFTDTVPAAVSVDFTELHIVNDGLADATFQIDAYYNP